MKLGGCVSQDAIHMYTAYSGVYVPVGEVAHNRGSIACLWIEKETVNVFISGQT